MRSTRIRPLLIAPAIAALLALTGCSGGAPEGRPAVADIAAGFQKVLEEQGQGSVLTPEQITCVSEKLHASDLSDGVLTAIATGDESKADQSEATHLTEVTSKATQECLLG